MWFDAWWQNSSFHGPTTDLVGPFCHAWIGHELKGSSDEFVTPKAALVVMVCLFLYSQVQTNLNQMSESKFMVEIPEADDVNHIVVFMTGTAPFPDGMGGAGKKD